MFQILIISLFFLIPLLLVYLSEKYKIINKIGPVVLMYVLGLITGNIGILPKNFDKVQDNIVNISLGLALPLVLFSVDLIKHKKMLKHTLEALLLGVVSLIISLFAAYFIFKKSIPQLDKIIGLLTGLYTGGTPNLASLKIALNIDQNIYIIVHTADLIIGSFVLLFVITIAQKLFNLFLPKFNEVAANKLHIDINNDDFEKYNTLKDFFKGKFKDFAHPFIFAIIVMLISLGLSKLFTKSADIVVIICLTTLSIAMSFIKFVQKLNKSFLIGMYFIYVFCFVIASMADIKEIFALKAIDIELLVLFVVIASFVIHAILSAIFKVDTDTFLISTTALVYSSPFVPVVADALKNRYIIASGIIISLVGYLIGNYLGILIALIL